MAHPAGLAMVLPADNHGLGRAALERRRAADQPAVGPSARFLSRAPACHDEREGKKRITPAMQAQGPARRPGEYSGPLARTVNMQDPPQSRERLHQVTEIRVTADGIASRVTIDQKSRPTDRRAALVRALPQGLCRQH